MKNSTFIVNKKYNSIQRIKEITTASSCELLLVESLNLTFNTLKREKLFDAALKI